MMARHSYPNHLPRRSGISQYFNAKVNEANPTTRPHALSTEFSTFLDKPHPEKLRKLHHVDRVLDLTEMDGGHCPQTPLCGPESIPRDPQRVSKDREESNRTRFADDGQAQIPKDERVVEILRRFYGEPARAARCETSRRCHKTSISKAFSSTRAHDQQEQGKISTMANPRSTLHSGSSRYISVSPEGTAARLPYRPRRSRAIAIKRTEEKIDENRESSSAEYDWATWRMYNRIIDHRQKYPLTYTVDESRAAGGTKNEMTAPPPDDSKILANVSMTATTSQATDYSQYGEVFDLDM